MPRKSFLQNRELERLPPFIKSDINSKLLNAVLFQLGWFACVLGGDVIAFAVTVSILCIHKALFVDKRFEWSFIAAVALAGFIIDNSLAWLGVFTFQSPSLLLMPFWMMCIWLLFAMTLNHSLIWLKDRLWLASVLGAISGPMAYFAGSKLANVALSTPPTFSLLSISVCWAVLLPVFFVFIRYQEATR